MGLSIGIGGDVDYYERDADNECELTQDLGEHEHDLHEGSGRQADYYSGDVDAGRELAGQWRGPGVAKLGLKGRVTNWQLHKFYGEHVDPISMAQLGNKPRVYTTPEERLAKKLATEPLATPERIREIELSISQKTQHNRNFFDGTFSLPKSYSIVHAALLAAGRDEEAQALLDAHHWAIDQCMDIYMAEAGFSRKGHHGRKVAGWTAGQHIAAHDWNYSYFDHRTSRAGDPQLHTHVLINNVVECEDGVWRTIDSRALFKQSRSIGALHERFMAERTAQTMGLQHRARADGFGWEVEGVEQADIDLFSTRRRAIEVAAEGLVSDFISKYNREPNAVELDDIMQAATLQTRPAKPHELTYEEYVASWDERFERARGERLADILDRVPMSFDQGPAPYDGRARREVLQMAVAQVEAKYPTWGRPQLRQAISDLLPPNLGRVTADELVPYLDAMVDEAVRGERVVTLSLPAAVEAPESLRHENGRSVYEPFHVERFTTTARLTSEGRLVALAQRTDGPRLSKPDAARLIAETTLYDDQARVAHEVLTRGRRLTWLEAKAGTGKSFTIGQVALMWDFGIGGKVLGLAKSQNATEVLSDEGLRSAFNFDAFRTAQEEMAKGGHSPKAMRTMRERYGVDDRTLLIVDEISTLSDSERFWLEEFARQSNVSMFWVGDRGQVGAVGADAALDVLAEAVPPLQLDVARRFTHEWEGPASLGLHDGDLVALAQYEAHGRIVSGTREEMDEQAIRTLVGDIVQGRNALLMVPTTELADQYSSFVRQELIDLGVVDASKRMKLRNETYVSPGDVIQARHTTKQIPGAQLGEGISNRDTFHVQRIRPDGSLVIRQHLGHSEKGAELGPERVLPAGYVRSHVELGYVTTVHSKIGRTVERGYELVTDSSSWSGVYTGATRGKDRNVIFVPVKHEEGVAVESGVDVLARLAERDEREMSATAAQREEREAVTHMARLGPILENEMVKQTASDHMEILGRVLSAEQMAQLEADDATGALLRLTHALEREGHDVEVAIAGAVGRRELDTADSLAQVLHWRLAERVGAPPPQDIAFSRRRFADRVGAGDTPEHEFVRKVAEKMDERVDVLAQRQVDEPDPWAIRHLGEVPTDPMRRLEWADRAGQVAAYREQYGFTDPDDAIGDAPGRTAAEQRASWEEAYTAIGRPAADEDVARLSEGELLLNVDQYRRREAWMPPDVSDRLQTTSIAARDYETRAAIDRARGDIESADRGDRIAASMAERAAKFEEIAAARRTAEQFTEDERDLANRSLVELNRRHRRDVAATADDREAYDPAVELEQERERTYTLDAALERARQVQRDIEAERAQQEAHQRASHQDHDVTSSQEHGYGYGD